MPAALPRAACRGWSSVTTVSERGVHVADGLTGTWQRRSDVRRGLWVTRTANAVFGEATGFDGATAWSQDRSGAAHPLDAVSARRVARTNAWLVRRGWCADRAAYSVFGLGERGATRGFRVTPAAGTPVEVWFGRRDGLPVRTVFRLNENQLAIETNDWRTVGPAVFPFEQRLIDPEDATVETFATRAIEVNAALPPHAFRAPAAPRDAFIAGAARASVPLIVEAQKPIVEVMIDGRGPFPFVVDTGAHLHIDADVARRLGIVPAGLGNSTGQGTQISKNGFARVPELRIGTAVLRNQVAIITSYPWSRIQRAPQPPKAGWLGVELFERFRVTLDPRRGRLELAAPGAAQRTAATGARLPVTFDEDAPLVPCTVDGQSGPCMIDTGNAGETIVEAAWAMRAGLAQRFARGLDTPDGYRVARADIGVGPLHARRELTEYYGPFSRGSESTTVEAAILSEGLTGSYRMTVDYAHHAIWLAPPSDAGARPYTRTGIFAAKQPSGVFIVANVLPNSTGARADVRPGDVIVRVDGRPAPTVSSAQLWSASRGPVGSALRLRVRRSPSQRTFDVSVRLADIIE